MAAILPAIKSRLFVSSYRRIARALEGEYATRSSGRSHDFDDLRDYVAGDAIRDIDWKATVRSGTPQVKRYTATGQRTLALVMDTSAAMHAAAPSGEDKRDVAALAAGVMALLAVRHRDRVRLVHGDSRGVTVTPGTSTERGIERELVRARESMSTDAGAPDIATLIAAGDSLPREAILVIVSGEVEPDGPWRTALDRAAARRDVLWVEVADANPARVLAASAGADAMTGAALPRHLGSSAGLRDRYDEYTAARWESVAAHLDRRRVSRARLTGTERAPSELLAMLARRPYAR